MWLVLRSLLLLTWLLSVSVVPRIAHGADEASAERKQILLLSQGPDGHAKGTHEYHAGMRVLAECLKRVPEVEVKHAHADGDWPEGPELIRSADGVVLFVSEGAKWIHQDPRRLAALAELSGQGGGFVCLHWGMGTRDAQYIDGFLKLFGGCHGGPDRKYQVVDTELAVVQREHPITIGIKDIQLHEEFYYKLKFIDAQDKLKPVLEAKIDGTVEPVAWAWERGDGGRSFGFSGGHFHDNWRHTEYRRVMSQAVLWSVKLEIPTGGLTVDIDEALLTLD